MHQMTPWHVNLPYYYVPSYSEGYVRSRKGFFFHFKKRKIYDIPKIPTESEVDGFPPDRKSYQSEQFVWTDVVRTIVLVLH